MTQSCLHYPPPTHPPPRRYNQFLHSHLLGLNKDGKVEGVALLLREQGGGRAGWRPNELLVAQGQVSEDEIVVFSSNWSSFSDSVLLYIQQQLRPLFEILIFLPIGISRILWFGRYLTRYCTPWSFSLQAFGLSVSPLLLHSALAHLVKEVVISLFSKVLQFFSQKYCSFFLQKYCSCILIHVRLTLPQHRPPQILT